MKGCLLTLPICGHHTGDQLKFIKINTSLTVTIVTEVLAFIYMSSNKMTVSGKNNGFVPDLAFMRISDFEEKVNLETLHEDCFRKIAGIYIVHFDHFPYPSFEINFFP